MIKIKQWEKSIVKFLFYYTLVIQGLMSLLGLPQAVLYVKDIVMVIAVMLVVYAKINEVDYKSLPRQFISILCVFFMCCLVSGVGGNVPNMQIVIAIRKLFRGFIYMFLCSEFLNIKDVNSMIYKAYKLQFINMLIIIVQRIVLNFDQDNCNGIFGTGLTNNYNGILCLFLVCYCTAEYINNRCGIKFWVWQLMINFIIAVVAELKVLIFLIPISIIIIMREKLFSGRGLKISLFLCVGMVVAIIGFGTMYNDQLNVFTSITGLLNYNNWGLATHAIVTRTNWMEYTLENIFQDSFYLKTMGIGFGEISGSLSSYITIGFYRSLGYGSYCASTLFLETGFVGLLLIFIWFISLWINSFKKSQDNWVKIMRDSSKAFVFAMIIFLVYSNFLYNDSVFLTFFAFSLPFIAVKESERVIQQTN